MEVKCLRQDSGQVSLCSAFILLQVRCMPSRNISNILGTEFKYIPNLFWLWVRRTLDSGSFCNNILGKVYWEFPPSVYFSLIFIRRFRHSWILLPDQVCLKGISYMDDNGPYNLNSNGNHRKCTCQNLFPNTHWPIGSRLAMDTTPCHPFMQ